MVILLLIFSVIAFTPSLVTAKTEWQRTTINRLKLAPEMSVKVSARIGGYLFDIEGLTSPWAKVSFYSTEGNINVATLANDRGQFRFRSVLAPLQTGDFCFLSYDIDGIANNPLCFSPPPPRTKTTIKGVVLSPSISLEKGIFRQGEPVAAQGRTFPEAEIKVFLFEENRPFWRELLDLVRPAFAREGPKLTITADRQGRFSFNLPTQKSSRWRFFVAPQLDPETPTAKSNTLEFSALAWWQWQLIKILRWFLCCLNFILSQLFSWQTTVLVISAAILILIKRLRTMNQRKVRVTVWGKSAPSTEAATMN